MSPTRARGTPLLFFYILLMLTIPSHVHANPDELYVSTSKPGYGLGATVNVYGTLSLGGAPVTNGLVAVQVEDSSGALRLIRVLNTGTSPPPWKVQLLEFMPCDSDGNLKTSFSRGSLAYFKATVENLDPVLDRQVTVTFNVFDSVGVSIAFACASFPLAPGKRISYLTSMPIPSDAYTGTAQGVVNALTKWPKEGGHPYCPEQLIEFTITGASEAASFEVSESAATAPGSFNLSFKLPNTAMLGRYSVFTCARYNGWASTTFDYVWLNSDINRDGKVNILDISTVAKAFGSKVGDPKYDRAADMNGDGSINILDVAAVARDFGKSRA